MHEIERSRRYEWQDPAGGHEAAQASTGMELLQGVMAGKFPPPPIASTIDMQLVKVDETEAVFAITPQEFHYNPLGTMHGGVFATILDSALGCCIHARLGRGQGFTTLTLEVKYLRAATKDTGRLTCTGKVVSLGRQIATSEAEVRDARGKIYATATSTCIIFAPPPGSPTPT